MKSVFLKVIVRMHPIRGIELETISASSLLAAAKITEAHKAALCEIIRGGLTLINSCAAYSPFWCWL